MTSQQLAEARQTTGDRLSASFQPLAEMQAAVEAERRARQLMEEANTRSINQLERERDSLIRELQGAKAECANAYAASEAAREARDALREEFMILREELRHRVDELGLLEDRRGAVELGLEALRKAAAAHYELDGFQQGRIAELEMALEAERRAREMAEKRATNGETPHGHEDSSRRHPETDTQHGDGEDWMYRGIRDEIRELRELMTQGCTRKHPGSTNLQHDLGDLVEYGEDTAEAVTRPRHRQGSMTLMPGALDVKQETSDQPSGPQSSWDPWAKIRAEGKVLLKVASDPVKWLLSTHTPGNLNRDVGTNNSSPRRLDGDIGQGKLEISLMACLAAVLVLSILQIMTSPPYPHDYDHGVLQVASEA
ncbi:uncharacterized protein B0H18DRAFT_327849 [Fomitopsis serialis]|uniref:uncharacterized protein n=1 Tax=Fomitopsis serialis TaxID=139415 RepID=UPI002007BBA0|nr:uncharacterized protein B0H18DRAFT_327849 [Neoantrodia serialis]KAH9936625.1 hypothetical protein B0H18DRAFT_327849 [Neoantrodia serialis]